MLTVRVQTGAVGAAGSSLSAGGEQGHGGVILGRSSLESTLSQDEEEIIPANTFWI